MTDSIFLEGIECWTHIGISEEERKKEQCLMVSIEIFDDLKKVGASDDLSKGIDYDKVVRIVQECVHSERKTVEKLAEDIADTVLTRLHPESVKVSIKKRIIPGTRGCHITTIRP